MAEPVGCRQFSTLDEAKAFCSQTLECGGITMLQESLYEVRQSDHPMKSNAKETSWPKKSCFVSASPEKVWHTFREAMEKALDDPSLHLDSDFGPPREDDSIFISISSYRDESCPASVRKAYQRAAFPERLNVGVVQQNCMANCKNGQGWANTRKLVDSKPNTDCIKEFCSTPLGKPHCDAGRVRILRVGESEALGPLFARYLNAKLWRGETYFMQIDSHTNFRSSWDDALIQMIKKTPSYPHSIISNYPPSGTAESGSNWGAAKLNGVESSKGGLCGLMFERLPGHQSLFTVRLQQSAGMGKAQSDGSPPYTGFIAAGFFFSHGSIVAAAPPDPFLPFIFMGEEIAITLRSWTAGFDIYGPSVDVVSHEYVRSHSIKFWESVGIVFDNGGLHNAISALIIPRIQHLVGFPEALRPDQVKPSDLLVKSDEYGIGKVRSLKDFVKVHNMNLEQKTQTAPAWCKQGKPSESAIKK